MEFFCLLAAAEYILDQTFAILARKGDLFQMFSLAVLLFAARLLQMPKLNVPL